MDSKSRFTNRVDAYVAARPGYPLALLEWMRQELGLVPEHVIADIGSGTGLLSRLLLDNGNVVIGVEPNDAMRIAGDRYLGDYRNFRSVAGSAEATTLPECSVDFITAGQALHWFDPPTARLEFERISRHGCWTVFVWNEARIDGSPLAHEYEKIKERYGRDFNRVRRENTSEAKLDAFYGSAGCQDVTFANPCRYMLDQFRQRAASSSYLPAEGDSDFEPMIQDLTTLHARYADGDGAITYDHDTHVFYARIP